MLTSYLTRPCELEKHARLCTARGETPVANGWLDQIHWLAGGDDDLFGVMWSFANFSHAFDDLIDGSNWEPDLIEGAMARLHDMVVAPLRHQSTSPATVNFLQTWHALIDANCWQLDDCRLANKAMSDFFMDLSRNPFARKFNRELETVFVQCMCRCLDGDAMAASPDAAVRVLAPAVRCGDVDALMHMVYLARGWVGLRAVSGWRQYDAGDDQALQRESLQRSTEHGSTVPVKHLTTMEAQ